jgi:hypothetical protein
MHRLYIDFRPRGRRQRSGLRDVLRRVDELPVSGYLGPCTGQFLGDGVDRTDGAVALEIAWPGSAIRCTETRRLRTKDSAIVRRNDTAWFAPVIVGMHRALWHNGTRVAIAGGLRPRAGAGGKVRARRDRPGAPREQVRCDVDTTRA